MTAPPIRISVAESEVMDVLWGTSSLAAEQVAAALAGRQDWTEGTIKTLLRRLMAKGAISAQAEGRRFLYSPVLSRADYVAGESQGLLGRLFGGSVASLVTHFVDREALSDQEMEEIRRVMRRIEDDR